MPELIQSSRFIKKMEEVDFSCCICCDVFKDPVVLTCSHSFCKVCIERWWMESQEDQGKTCPICKKRASRKELIRNLALRNATEVLERWKVRRMVLERETEEICSVHSEKHRLFCLNDLKPICLVCRHSEAHEHHRFRPIVEAAEDLRGRLEESLTPLTDKLNRLQQFGENGELCLLHIKRQASQTKKIIQDEFEKLHQFLVGEEEAQLRALKEEEEQKTCRMEDEIADVNRKIKVLSETIRATEEQLRSADVSFLLKYKTTAERVQSCPLLEEPQLGPGALIDQAKHLGNLAFNIWSRMKSLVHYSPVILDPNTAHPELVLSDDLTSFTPTLEDEQKLPKNPERVRMDLETVRASVGFSSGSHTWVVDVGNCTDWELGVVTESTYYILDVEELEKDMGWWSFLFKDGEYKTFTAHKGEGSALNIGTRLRRIRVHLQCNKRKLTFYDADTNKLIHSFTQIHQQKLFPVFVSGSEEPITILPQQIMSVDKLIDPSMTDMGTVAHTAWY